MKHDPILYEPKSMFCEISSIVGGLIAGGASLIGGAMASDAAGDAAGAQVEAARIAADLGREGLDFQKEMFDISRADLSPYRATGGAALGTLSNLFIPGGQNMVQMHSQLNELRARRAVLARTGGGAPAQPATPGQQAAGGPPFNTPDEYRQWYSDGEQGILNRLDPGR